MCLNLIGTKTLYFLRDDYVVDELKKYKKTTEINFYRRDLLQ